MTIDREIIHADIESIVAEKGRGEHAVIPILHAIQDKYNYLPDAALRRVCEITEITPAMISGVSTFYSQFRHVPIGKHIIRICIGTACHVKGAGLVYEAFSRELHIPLNEDTDPEGRFTLQKVACLGCCSLAPVVQIDEITYGHVQSNGITPIIKDFLYQASRKGGSSEPFQNHDHAAGEIRIGLDSCCIASGSTKIRQTLERCLQETGITAHIKRVGCMGMSHREPLMEVHPPDEKPVLYDNVNPDDVKRILLKHFKPKTFHKRIVNAALSAVETFFIQDDRNGYTVHQMNQRDQQIEAFLGRQQHIVTEYYGQMDPLNLQEYRSKGGFEALAHCLKTLSPEEVIDEITSSGLRGRGGAGFPTGRKWQLVRDAEDEIKYVICNGDEGDPGAFMDRMILESYPYRVIEGMIIAAYAVGANEGFLYIRAEYPLAIHRIERALDQCLSAGLSGTDILKSGYELQLNIMEGAGAFVCGEETALITSIEGNRGTPRFRPPYPSQDGLWGHSTLVNNCETLATVPWIMRNGSSAFTRFGTRESKGTKVFSLAGKVSRGGLIEVPMGITIREIVEDIGGGVEKGRQFKAVQIGGPSGGCIPAEMAHIKVDFEALTQVGAMMGSGGLLVMDDSDCMVDIARYFLAFTCDQSCGKCTFCRIGTHQMLHILEKICEGKGSHEDLDKLEEIAIKTKQSSLCGLGKSAQNPVLTTLAYFREEYEAHIDGICPAKRCQALITYSITDECIGCTLCAQNCPAGAIPITPYQKHEIIQDKCIKCGGCRQVCPNDSVIAI